MGVPVDTIASAEAPRRGVSTQPTTRPWKYSQRRATSCRAAGHKAAGGPSRQTLCKVRLIVPTALGELRVRQPAPISSRVPPTLLPDALPGQGLHAGSNCFLDVGDVAGWGLISMFCLNMNARGPELHDTPYSRVPSQGVEDPSQSGGSGRDLQNLFS